MLKSRVVCAPEGGGDIAYTKGITGPWLIGHKKGCIGCVAKCPASDSGPW